MTKPITESELDDMQARCDAPTTAFAPSQFRHPVIRNSEHVANSKTDIPRLIAEVQRLRGKLADANDILSGATIIESQFGDKEAAKMAVITLVLTASAIERSHRLRESAEEQPNDS